MQNNNFDDEEFEAMLKIALEEVMRLEIQELLSYCNNDEYKPSPRIDKIIRNIIVSAYPPTGTITPCPNPYHD
jgi:hypothetical protein